MKVLFLNAVLDLYLIPTEYPIATDTLTLEFRNEFTDVKTVSPVSFEITERLKITITTQPADFKIRSKYEIELKNGTDIIYMGKAIVLASGTDVQNYEYNSQPNARYDYKAT
jgi:hypothetical protein